MKLLLTTLAFGLFTFASLGVTAERETNLDKWQGDSCMMYLSEISSGEETLSNILRVTRYDDLDASFSIGFDPSFFAWRSGIMKDQASVEIVGGMKITRTLTVSSQEVTLVAQVERGSHVSRKEFVFNRSGQAKSLTMLDPYAKARCNF